MALTLAISRIGQRAFNRRRKYSARVIAKKTMYSKELNSKSVLVPLQERRHQRGQPRSVDVRPFDVGVHGV